MDEQLDSPTTCTAIVVTYNNRDQVRPAIESLLNDAPNTKVVVVDNASTDGTVDVARRIPGVLTIESGGNLGYAAAINRGRECADYDSPILILNADLTVEPGSVTAMLEALNHTHSGVVVPQILQGDGRIYRSIHREPSIARAAFDALLGPLLPNRPAWMGETEFSENAYLRPRAISWASGAALLVAARCNTEVGPWDERFFLYSEETDFFRRARSLGFRAVYTPCARVRHSEGGSGRSDALAALMAVNRVRYYEKYHGWTASLVFRGLVILHELCRSKRPAHRRTALLLCRRSRWPVLVSDLRKEAPLPSRRPVTPSVRSAHVG